MGDDIFLSKFASKKEKKMVFMGGQWHFDRALPVLSGPIVIRDVKKKSFTHTSFRVQIHNITIMLIDRNPIQKLGENVGNVEEIETDEASECIGQFAQVITSVDIT